MLVSEQFHLHSLDVAGSTRVTGYTYMGSTQGLQVYSLGVAIPGSNSSNTYTTPTGVMQTKMISLTGIVYNGGLSYNITQLVYPGLTQITPVESGSVGLPCSSTFWQHMRGCTGTVTFRVCN